MSDAPRAVLLVLEATFPRHGGGGAESQVMSVAGSLLQRGVPVRVVAPRVAGGPQALRESVAGIDVTRIPYPRVRGVGGLVMLARLAALLVAERRSYAVIHAHIAHNMAAVCAVVGRLLGKPVFVKITGMHEMRGGILDARPGLAARLRKLAVARAGHIQATSSRIAGLLVERGFDREQVLVLPNGVDVARFLAVRRDADLRRETCGDARRVGVFVGRLAPEKGQELLVEAWARALRSDPGMKLLLVGDGPTREALGELARRLGIAEAVVFAGHRDDVAPWLAIADFALLTSHAEGLSNALLEYMAAGLPVIGSRVSGTEDFVAPGETGFLFEAGDAAGLAARLADMARLDPERLAAMGRAARASIVSRASLEAVTARLMSLYGLAPDAAAPDRGALQPEERSCVE